MPRSPIRTALTLVLALIASGQASAVPSAANSRIPAHVLLVGRVAELADTTAGAFSVVVNDYENVPMPDRVVELRLVNCTDARVSSNPYEPGTTIRCDSRGVLQTTDRHGEVRMTAVGGGNPAAAPVTGPCAQVWASPGIQLGIVKVAYLDLDGDGGTGSGDLSLWLADYASSEPRSRSDYDGDGTLSSIDLSIWLGVFAAGRSAQSAATYCP